MMVRNILWDRLVQSADLPLGAVSAEPLLEILGDKRVLIENHYGICVYERTKVIIKLKNRNVQICGDNLELLCFSKQQLVIGGRIDSVNFCRGE